MKKPVFESGFLLKEKLVFSTRNQGFYRTLGFPHIGCQTSYMTWLKERHANNWQWIVETYHIIAQLNDNNVKKYKYTYTSFFVFKNTKIPSKYMYTCKCT